jgi:hypothetical protein
MWLGISRIEQSFWEVSVKLGVWLLCLSSLSFGASVPRCRAGGRELSVNNNEVLRWKESTRTDFHARAHIDGWVVRIYPVHSNHLHFAVQIGDERRDTVEVVFSLKFGRPAGFGKGSRVEACGDFIQADRPSHGYPASPDGAIVHWVHSSPEEYRHPSGYLMIDGNVYGDER